MGELSTIIQNHSGLGLTLAGAVFVVAMIIITAIVIWGVVYYLNKRLDNTERFVSNIFTTIKEDYVKKTELLQHQKECGKADKVSEVLSKTIDELKTEIKGINKNITDLIILLAKREN